MTSEKEPKDALDKAIDKASGKDAVADAVDEAVDKAPGRERAEKKPAEGDQGSEGGHDK